MLKKLKKGFTLTELIIVIVIIGILAAVLIPSVSGYIKKAKISKGIQEAKEMNTILAAESIYQDKEYFEPYEVRKILVESDFKLESQLEDYRFWYDASINQVKYLSMDEAFGGISAAKKTFAQDCIEALSNSHPEYRYLDTYDDELTQVVDTVNNLVVKSLEKNSITNSSTMDQNTKNSVLDTMDELIGNIAQLVSSSKIKGVSSDVKKAITNYVNTFDTANSVYVDNYTMYNRAYFAADESELVNLSNTCSNINYSTTNDTKRLALEVSHMVFTTGITTIPTCDTTVGVEFDVVLTTTINIPNTVTTIQNNSFTNISYATSIVVNNTMLIDNNALSDAARSALTTINTNNNFVTLYLGTDFEINYENAAAKLNNGTIATYAKGENDPEVKLSTLIYEDNALIYDSTNTKKDDSALLSKYLIPSIKFNNKKIDFSKITKFIIRRSILNNICTYTGILIDEDLNSYKVESFGYITDIDWNIEQNFMGKDAQGNKVIGAEEATIKVYLPAYVYNFTNFKGASMEVTLLPQYIKSREETTLSGTIDVYDGIALSDQKIIFYIEDGVYDPTIGMYVYEKKIENLNQYTIMIGEQEVHCNQLYINQISVYTGNVEYDQETGEAITDNIDYLFIRYYK